MWKKLAKVHAENLKEISKNFVTAKLSNDIKTLADCSNRAQPILTDMFKELRSSQDHNELAMKLGENCDLGYYQNFGSDDFELFKKQTNTFNLNPKLNLRNCANAVFHPKHKDYYVDESSKHWLMFITDRDQLVIMDIQRVCEVIIENVKENPLQSGFSFKEKSDQPINFFINSFTCAGLAFPFAAFMT